MEARLNLALLGALLAAWHGASATAPEPWSGLPEPDRRALRDLEDAYAEDPTDVATARGLARGYVDAGRPEVAIAVLGGSPGAPLDDPAVAHRLAMAYEAVGRVDEALSLVDASHDRCGRVLGVGRAGAASTPVPRFGCTAGQHAALATHREALRLLREWGVVDPRRDPRTPRAYGLALRRARIASAP